MLLYSSEPGFYSFKIDNLRSKEIRYIFDVSKNSFDFASTSEYAWRSLSADSIARYNIETSISNHWAYISEGIYGRSSMK